MTNHDFKTKVFSVWDAAPSRAKEIAEGKLVDAVAELDDAVAAAFGFACWARVYFASIYRHEKIHEPSAWFVDQVDRHLSSVTGVPRADEWQPKQGWSCYLISGCFWASCWRGVGHARDMMTCLATRKNLQRVRSVRMTPHPGTDPAGQEVSRWFEEARTEMEAFKELAPGGSVKDLFVYERDRNA